LERRNFLALLSSSLFPFKFNVSNILPFKLNNRVKYVENYGALGDGSHDDTFNVERAIEDSIGFVLDWGGKDKVYRIMRPLVVPSNSTWVGCAEIYNQNDSDDMSKWACIHPGTFHPAYFEKMAKGEVELLNSDTIVFEKELNIDKGELVWLFSIDGYKRKSWQFPYEAVLLKIKEINGSFIEVDNKVDLAPGKYLMAKASDSNFRVMNNNSLQVCESSVIYGLRLRSKKGPAMQRGGMFRCNFVFSEICGTNGIFLNAICESSIYVQQMVCSRKFIDVAGNSKKSVVEVENASYQKNDFSENISLIAFNENSNNCIVKFRTLDCDCFDFNSSIGQFNSSKNCTLEVFNGVSLYGTGYAFTFQVADKETENFCMNNRFVLKKFKLGDSFRSAFWWNAGGRESYVHNCGVYSTRIDAKSFSSGFSAIVSGTNSFISPDSTIGGGIIKVENGAVNVTVN
jgi:hypothetical protein